MTKLKFDANIREQKYTLAYKINFITLLKNLKGLLCRTIDKQNDAHFNVHQSILLES